MKHEALTADDLADIRKFDPTNIEKWTLVDAGGMKAFQFQFSSRLPHPGYFKFLVLKFPDGYHMVPLYPNVDHEWGHDPHLLSRTVGQTQVKVICGPGGRAAKSLKEARDFALKWSVFTEGRLNSVRPGYS